MFEHRRLREELLYDRRSLPLFRRLDDLVDPILEACARNRHHGGERSGIEGVAELVEKDASREDVGIGPLEDAACHRCVLLRRMEHREESECVEEAIGTRPRDGKIDEKVIAVEAKRSIGRRSDGERDARSTERNERMDRVISWADLPQCSRLEQLQVRDGKLPELEAT